MLKLTGNSIKQIIKNIFKQINAPYQVVIINEDTHKESASFHLTKKSVYLLFSGLVVGLFLILSALLVLTPIKYYLPGMSSNINRKELLELRKLSDSLLIVDKQRESFVYNLIEVTNGNNTLLRDTLALNEKEIDQAKNQNEKKISKASNFDAIRFRKPDSATIQKMKEIDSLRRKK
jgi:hypothetical protein